MQLKLKTSLSKAGLKQEDGTFWSEEKYAKATIKTNVDQPHIYFSI